MQGKLCWIEEGRGKHRLFQLDTVSRHLCNAKNVAVILVVDARFAARRLLTWGVRLSSRHGVL